MSAEPARNIEIKAKLHDNESYEQKVSIAEGLTSEKGEIIVQHDVFFNSIQGRLKLRYLLHKPSELIYYDRPDTDGPKLSQYHKMDTESPSLLETILEKSMGVKGRVKKQRVLFIYENTRIHLDTVEGLGHFLEFEAVLKPDETIESGNARLDALLKTFQIEKKDLLEGAYMDELLKKA